MSKKSLTIVLLFVILIAAGIFAACKFYFQRDDLVWKVDLLEGELPKAEHMELDVTVRGGGDWAWDSKISLAEEGRIQTEYQNKKELKPYQYARILLDDFYQNAHYSGGYIQKKQAEDPRETQEEAVIQSFLESGFRQNPAIRDTLIEMVKDHESEKVIRLKDRMAYFPVFLESDPVLYDEALMREHQEEKEWELSMFSALDRYFHFPVKEDMSLKLHLSYAFDAEQSMDLRLQSAFLPPYDKEDFFHCKTLLDLEHNQVLFAFQGSDLYEIPKEYRGLYALPIRKAGEEQHFLPENAYTYRLSELKKIHDLQSGERTETIFFADDQIALLTKKDKEYRLHRFDRAKLARTEELELHADDKAIERILPGTDGILILYDTNEGKWLSHDNQSISFQGKPSLKALGDFPISIEDYSDVLVEEDTLYLVLKDFESVYLITLDTDGKQSLVRYSVPLGSADEIDPYTNQRKAYQIEEVRLLRR